ncbi:yml6 [Candida pseudojiufengensis]|uniref:yml6 n=1 Tax=Candida pseudojiufengensis TaxID=497109 RepID=UPI0022242DA8|nr:yml6 [Candida pseudojiufengensis]KAI5960836.1 yml6 [Candida pseudojiufengensis]
MSSIMFRQSIRRLATEATPIISQPISTIPTTITNSSNKLHISQPPKYTLAQLRTFPNLEPQTFIPLPYQFFNTDQPIRRDLLWSTVVYEADNSRVGSNYVITKSDSPYSNRKLRPQKGSGRARLGDANSPHMDNEIKAHAIKGYHDWSTDLPKKIYNKAIQTAFISLYKNGNLIVVKNECDFKQNNVEITQSFVSSHNLNNLNLLFITTDKRDNLQQSLKKFFLNDKELSKLSKREKAKAIAKVKGKVLIQDQVEVRDLLKANRVFIEKPALEWFISEYSV